MLRPVQAAAPDRRLNAAQQRIAHLSAENRRIRARYDAAQTTSENRKHWAPADGLSANAANSAEVRRTLRERARYETANNSYAQGIALTLANDTVGTGPRLQLLSESEADNERVEALFEEWAERDGLAGKLRTMRLARFQDGEAFALLSTDPLAPFRDVRLSVRLIECDRVASPLVRGIEQPVDGIFLDQVGNPIAYQVLRQHPGDHFLAGASTEVDEVIAANVLHYFVALRPEQARGIPEITPALHLFAQLRRYTLAVIAAAEVAADHAAVLQSRTAPNAEAETSVAAMDTFELEPRMVTTLPEGWELGQMRAEQPTTTYGDFKDRIINEIGRCLNMPFNVAACNSASYNYASGRLDHQVYNRALRIEQATIERAVLDRVFVRWMREATLIEGLLPQRFRMRGPLPPWQWFWDGSEHVDPEKEANAQETRLRTGMTTKAEEYGRRGRDWRAEAQQRLAERMAEIQDQAKLLEEARRLGLPDSVALATDSGKAPSAGGAGARSSDGGVADAKARLDAVGVAVRSGLVTPQEDDEARTRADLGLPPMSEAARKAWSEEPVRRPVTLAKEGAAVGPMPGQTDPSLVDQGDLANAR